MVYFGYMLDVQEHVALRDLTTFRLGATARYFSVIERVEDLKEAIALSKEKNIPYIVLGGGSNTIFSDEEVLEHYVLLMNIQGFAVVDDMSTHVLVQVGAGMNWDDVVRESVERGFGGIEALSAIPGSAGATPVQNVGAYGVDIAQVLENVEVFNTETGEIETLSAEACQFDYRDSIFKHTQGKKYIILSITLKLSKHTPVSIPNYPGVKEYFKKKGIVNPTLLDVRNAITEIRWTKLPDPKVLASCGSFFKNPIVENTLAEKLKAEYPNAVVHDVGGGFSKIGAGWLIDSLGHKGKEFGNLLIYERNALVIANKGDATKKELLALVTQIQKEVFEKFSIQIEPEPIFV